MGETENTRIERKPMRGMLAAIALASDLPLPTSVRFADRSLFLDFATITEGQAWAGFLSIDVAPYLNPNGRYYLGAPAGRWHGWLVHLWASEEPGELDDLDGDTAAALTAVAEVES